MADRYHSGRLARGVSVVAFGAGRLADDDSEPPHRPASGRLHAPLVPIGLDGFLGGLVGESGFQMTTLCYCC